MSEWRCGANGTDFNLPGGGTVFVEDVKVLAGEQLAPVDTRLNGTESSQNADLFDVADERNDVQTLQFGVDGVQASDQMFEEQFECLRQAQHRFAVDDEGSHFLAAVVD